MRSLGSAGGALLAVLVPVLLLVGCDGSGSARGSGTDTPRVGTTVPPGPAAPSGTAVPSGPSASTAASAPGGPTGPASPRPPRDATLVVVTRSGGIAGRRDSVVVNNDGAYTVLSSGRTAGAGRMRPAELGALREALAASGIERLPRVMFDRPAPDAFVYAVNHAGHEVAVSDAEPVPALQRVIAAVPLPS
ncbi:hypothetical protein ACFYYH_03675 [Streptomyces sp. NPDC002018]|uniref:hypothetical protein n=1 Tax=Streptomyces sp. NPDC002018 TaxID=3364629 RepID=UPI00368A3C01